MSNQRTVMGNESEFNTLLYAAQDLQHLCHSQSRKAGWWNDPKTGLPIQDNPFTFSNKLMLTVSELAEAMEADRKGLMDDHLPNMDGREVELADAVIRIFDLAGGFNLDLPLAIAMKMEYNANRQDHKLENRQAVGGKSY